VEINSGQGGFRAPGSTARIRIPEPPRLSTFKQRGGGPESGVHLFNGPDQSAQINGTLKAIPDPPCLSTFKRRGGGGGGVRNRAQLPNGRDLSTQINGARVIPSFSAALCLTNVGPSPCYVILLGHLSPVAMCHPSSSTLVQVVSSPSHHSLTTCHVSRSLPRQSSH
jgi:hypothetical protein